MQRSAWKGRLRQNEVRRDFQESLWGCAIQRGFLPVIRLVIVGGLLVWYLPGKLHLAAVSPVARVSVSPLSLAAADRVFLCVEQLLCEVLRCPYYLDHTKGSDHNNQGTPRNAPGPLMLMLIDNTLWTNGDSRPKLWNSR